jgi:hypothetical protein
MRPTQTWMALAAAVCGAAGCITPWNTRLPTLQPVIPAVERRAAEIHDPYAVPDLGPETQTRPPNFVEPRSEQRRLIEGRMLRDALPGGVPAAPALPPSAWQYPQAVQP